MWSAMQWYYSTGSRLEDILTPFVECLVAGTITALAAYFIADIIARGQIIRLFPQLDTLSRPVNFKLKKTLFLIL